jgi:hypothetical protein
MTTINIPKKLAIYYSFPSLVNGAAGNITAAVNTFKNYDMVVFGEGLEKNSHPDHSETVSIIADPNMANTEVYGYIDGTRALNDFKTRVDQWKTTGAKGILVDRFGYDFGVSRLTQNTYINYIHSKNMNAFIDVWNPDDVFSPAIDLSYNPTGLACVVNSNDIYMAESFQIINGIYQDPTFWKTKSEKMINYRNTFGTKMACTTTYNNTAFSQSKMDYAYYSCILYNFDAFCWGEFNYSASNNSLPFRTRKVFYGNKFVNNIIEYPAKFNRNTNIGIHIDTVNHTVSSQLD